MCTFDNLHLSAEGKVRYQPEAEVLAIRTPSTKRPLGTCASVLPRPFRSDVIHSSGFISRTADGYRPRRPQPACRFEPRGGIVGANKGSGFALQPGRG